MIIIKNGFQAERLENGEIGVKLRVLKYSFFKPQKGTATFLLFFVAYLRSVFIMFSTSLPL